VGQGGSERWRRRECGVRHLSLKAVILDNQVRYRRAKTTAGASMGPSVVSGGGVESKKQRALVPEREGGARPGNAEVHLRENAAVRRWGC